MAKRLEVGREGLVELEGEIACGQPFQTGGKTRGSDAQPLRGVGFRLLLGGKTIGLRPVAVFLGFDCHPLVGDRGLAEDFHRSRHRSDFVGAVGIRNLRIRISLGQPPHRGGDAGNRIGNAGQHEDDGAENEQSGKADRGKQFEFYRVEGLLAEFGGLVAAADVQFDQGAVASLSLSE